MNAPRDLGPDFRSWLRDVPAMPADLPGRTLDRTRHIRQRRRWLWFLPGSRPTAGAEGRQDQGRWPASTQTHFTGGMTMITPAKMITVAAVAALAGTLLLAGRFATQDPATQTFDSQGPGEISATQGQMIAHSQYDQGNSTTVERGVATTDELWTAEFRMDDPRLNVAGQSRLNEYAFGKGGPKSWTGYFENDDGSWTATARAYTAATTGGWHHQILMTGQGGYEGLTAILSADQETYSGFLDVHGAIFTGELPPLPGPAPTTSD